MSSPIIANLQAESPEYQAFADFARLTGVKRDLADQLREVEGALKALEPQLLAYLGETGYQMVRIHGFTLSAHRDPWVYPRRGVNRSTICQVLKACGLAHYVTENFNTRSLTRYVRELEVEEEEHILAGGSVLDVLPPALANVIEVKPAYHIQALKKGSHQ